MCQHYVSDLVWAVLKTNLVPVVFGKKIDKAHKILKKKPQAVMKIHSIDLKLLCKKQLLHPNAVKNIFVPTCLENYYKVSKKLNWMHFNDFQAESTTLNCCLSDPTLMP